MRSLKNCLLAILWPVVNGYAQSPPSQAKPLNIGDPVPDILISNLHNYPVSKIHLSDLKNKLVILDFWAIWCGSCLSYFPKIDSLQTRFKEKLLFILIEDSTSTVDSKEKVDSFLQLKRNEFLWASRLVFATERLKYLYGLFPHMFLPHYIWIGRKHKILAITSSEEITEINIRAVLNGEKIHLPFKADRYK
ncbi:MAG TPA: TlpA family protein disulfide reductase [Puia sp.]